jgi:YgiT-type zinc finger domain-containing protein
MKCAACQNNMVMKKGTIDLRISEKLCFVRNVSYEECLVCGERVLSPKVSQNIFERIKTRQFIEETVKIPVLDCA